MRNRLLTIKEASICALFLALISAGAYMSLSIGVVPVVLQNFFIILAALLLSPKLTAITVISYLVAGALGLPVFAQGKSGIFHVLGPTGGYLIAYLPGAVLASIAAKRLFLGEIISSSVAALLFISIVYLCGIPWLMFSAKISFNKAVAVGFTPFIIPDLVKLALAVLVSSALRPAFTRVMN